MRKIYIINAAHAKIINMDQVQKITLAKKDDAVVLMAGFGPDDACAIGRFYSEEEAREALTDLFTATYDGPVL